MCVHIYMYFIYVCILYIYVLYIYVLYIYVCVCIYIYIYTQRERERERMDFCNSQACVLPIDLISLPDIILVHPCKFHVWHTYPGEIDGKKFLVDK